MDGPAHVCGAMKLGYPSHTSCSQRLPATLRRTERRSTKAAACRPRRARPGSCPCRRLRGRHAPARCSSRGPQQRSLAAARHGRCRSLRPCRSGRSASRSARRMSRACPARRMIPTVSRKVAKEVPTCRCPPHTHSKSLQRQTRVSQQTGACWQRGVALSRIRGRSEDALQDEGKWMGSGVKCLLLLSV